MAEMRLIDANDLECRIQNWKTEVERCDGISPFIVSSTLETVIRYIKDAPTVEVTSANG